jgi:hypothetical protein
MGLHQPVWCVAPGLLDEAWFDSERVKEGDLSGICEQDMDLYSKRTSNMPHT